MYKDTKDFFISYNKEDKEYAKWIAGTLEENKYTTYIQAWDFKPGNNFILQMQEAIKKYNCDPTGENKKLIPVRVDNVNPDGLLSNKVIDELI